MNYVLTTYLHPLEEKIALIGNKNIFLDNLRSEEEISELFEIIKASYDNSDEAYGFNSIRIPPNHEDDEIISIRLALESFFANSSNSDYVNKVKDEILDSDILLSLAKMWVVVRYPVHELDENKSSAELPNSSKKPSKAPIVSNQDHLRYPSFEEVRNLMSLISYLIVPDGCIDFYGHSIVPYEEHIRFRNPINHELNLNIFYFSICAFSKTRGENENWRFILPSSLDEIIKWSNKIQVIIDSEYDQIQYIGSVLNSLSDNIKDDRQKLVALVGIIELLLTHNPDFKRFNVEDSISKQFKLKTSILLFMDNNEIDLQATKKLLNTMYSQRSNIAHGNFLALKKYLKSLGEYEDGTEKGFDILLTDVYRVVITILRQYLKNPTFIKYLKEN